MIKTEKIFKDNNEYYEVTMDDKVYDLPFKVLGGKKVAFLDISGQVSLVETTSKLLVDKIIALNLEFDTILNPVSKSNALAHAIAVNYSKKTGKNIDYTVVARKNLSDTKVSATYHSVTTKDEQLMSLSDDDAEYIKGKKVLLVDDVYGAGGTTNALKSLCEKAQAQIVGHALIAVEKGSILPEGLIYLFELPLAE